MAEGLQIREIRESDYIELILIGRLDAFGSRTLEDELEGLIKQGSYKFSLNFREVAFLSSAGIRVLIKFFKQLKSVGGYLRFTQLSEKVAHVVQLAGLNYLFEESETPEENIRKKEDIKHLESESLNFQVLKQGSESMGLYISGKPEQANSGYGKNDVRNIKFSGDTYALGLGAIGDDFEQCKDRIGEYLGVGNVAVYMPTDGTKSADYMQKTHQLIPNVISLYSLLFKGKWASFLNFETKANTPSAKLSEIVDEIFKLHNTEAIGLVMVAETAGLCGCNLNTSPISKGSRSLLEFPYVKDHINFTTEPEFEDHLTLTVAVIHRDKTDLKPYTRPYGSAGLEAHFHTAVFNFRPIQKDNDNLEEIVDTLLETTQLKGLLHLLDDNRLHNGIGESTFKRGSCWVAPLELINSES